MPDVIAGRFALCDPIARGGSGVVWRAYDRRVGKFCAAKVLRRRDAGDLLRFVREQSVRLSHPNVLTPYSWAAEDTHVAIASDLVDGGSLSTLIGDYGALSEGTVAVVLDQLLAALEAVHEAGLVHRDVKPGNLLLHATGTGPLHVVLGDFGLAISEQDARLTQFGMIVGTPGYVAPELLTGTTPVQAGQDLYAAGRVAAALLCGAEPTSGAGQPDLGTVRDRALRELVELMIEVNPAKRPRSAQAARHWLHSRVTADPQPRSRDGGVVDVMQQLPPLPPWSELSSSWDDATSVPIAAASAGAVGSVGAMGPTAVTPGRHGRADAPGHRPTRRGLLVGAGVAVLAAAATVTGVVLAGNSGGNPTPSPTRPGRSATGAIVQPNAVCTWAQQNDAALTPDGTAVRCRLDGNRYRWLAA